jgi:hypothetical protein
VKNIILGECQSRPIYLAEPPPMNGTVARVFFVSLLAITTQLLVRVTGVAFGGNAATFLRCTSLRDALRKRLGNKDQPAVIVNAEV